MHHLFSESDRVRSRRNFNATSLVVTVHSGWRWRQKRAQLCIPPWSVSRTCYNHWVTLQRSVDTHPIGFIFRMFHCRAEQDRNSVQISEHRNNHTPVRRGVLQQDQDIQSPFLASDPSSQLGMTLNETKTYCRDFQKLFRDPHLQRARVGNGGNWLSVFANFKFRAFSSTRMSTAIGEP